MRTLSWVEVKSDKDAHFTGGLAQNAGENEDIATGLEAKSAAVVGVIIESDQNLDWELWFASKTCATTFGNADLDLDGVLGYVSFSASSEAKQHGDTPAQYIYTKWLPTPIALYDDERAASNLGLHMRLVNRSATAKTAGAPGEVVVRLILDAGVK